MRGKEAMSLALVFPIQLVLSRLMVFGEDLVLLILRLLRVEMAIAEGKRDGDSRQYPLCMDTRRSQMPRRNIHQTAA